MVPLTQRRGSPESPRKVFTCKALTVFTVPGRILGISGRESMSAVTADTTRSLHELERQYRVWEGVFSLIRTLGTSLEVDRIATLSLMTVTGQLSIQRAALYLHEPSEDSLVLCQTIGVRKARMVASRLRVPDKLHEILVESDGVARLRASFGLDPALLAHFEYGGYLSDGSDFVGLVLFGPKADGLDFDEQELRLLQTMGVVVGMTVRKAMLHERMATMMERMEQTEQLRRAIIDHVSHELSTPLLVIKDAAEMARTAEPEVQEEFWDMHREAVDRLHELVRAVTLVGDHHLEDPAELEWIDAEECIQRVLRPILQRVGTRSIPVRLHADVQAALQVQLSVRKLGAAFESLLDNAWKFRRADRPDVVVNCYAARRGWWQGQEHLPRVALYRDADLADLDLDPEEVLFADGQGPDEPEHADRLVFLVEVIDSGLGIPEEDLDAVFEPFRQASNSPTLGVRGAGMGLTAARKLARDMNGSVELRSRVDHGSVFAIVLPARVTEPS